MINCDNLEVIPTRTYGGLTGAKIAVIYNGDVYMLKCGQVLRDKNIRNVEISVGNDPISEYIGSHIYEVAGLPVHETVLGMYQDRPCVLCKDLAYPNSIVEFRSLRNRLMDIGVIQANSGMSTYVNDIMQVIVKTDNIDKHAVLQRFWDMFVIDALIGNTDRNNGNWGFFINGNQFVLAPVYDNGGALNYRRSDAQMAIDLRTGNIKNIALNFTTNLIIGDKRINPLHYLRDHNTDPINMSLANLKNITEDKIKTILQSVELPMSIDRYNFYLTVLMTRLNYLKNIRTK